MMKQPADNPNATPAEEIAARERATRPVRDQKSEEEEISAVTAELEAQEPGADPKRLRAHAEEIVRNRNMNLAKE
jgi:hypothetical protein